MLLCRLFRDSRALSQEKIAFMMRVWKFIRVLRALLCVVKSKFCEECKCMNFSPFVLRIIKTIIYAFISLLIKQTLLVWQTGKRKVNDIVWTWIVKTAVKEYLFSSVKLFLWIKQSCFTCIWGCLCLLGTIIWVRYRRLFPVCLYYTEDTLSLLSELRSKTEELKLKDTKLILINVLEKGSVCLRVE